MQTENGQGMTKLVNYINSLALQLPQVFVDHSHETGYLLRAVIRHEWAQQTTSQLAAARYTLTKFITALHERIQLEEEVSRATAPDINSVNILRIPKMFVISIIALALEAMGARIGETFHLITNVTVIVLYIISSI